MVSKEVTRKEEALEHHKASVHHGTLLLALHLVCIHPSNSKTTLCLQCNVSQRTPHKIILPEKVCAVVVVVGVYVQTFLMRIV